MQYFRKELFDLSSDRLFIHLLSCYLNGEKPVCKKDVDWNAIYALSQKHDVTAVISKEIKELEEDKRPKGKLLSAFNQRLEYTVKNYEYKTQAITLLVKLLSEAKINHLLIKGAVLRYLYPVPELRTSGDTDVVISPSDYENTVEVLKNGGFSVETVGTTVAELKYNDEVFEIHTELEYINIQSKIYFSTPFDDISEHSGYTYKLKPFYHLLYVITHIAHHLKNGGAGIRMIMDIDALLRYYPDINIEKFIALCDYIRIKKTALVLIALSKKWFNTPVAIDFTFEDSDEEDFYKNLSRIILNGGVFGEDNDGISDEDKSGLGASVKALFGRIFPHPSNLQEHFTYCTKRKYLVPIAWFHYLFLVIFGKFGNSNDKLEEMFEQKEMSEKYYEVLKELQIDSNTHYD